MGVDWLPDLLQNAVIHRSAGSGEENFPVSEKNGTPGADVLLF